MNVKTENVDELLTFEQIDELAKEIYVQLVKDKANELVDPQSIEDETVEIAVNDKFAHILSTQAYKLAEQWFVSKNERLKLYHDYLIELYSNEENRKNCEKWLNKSWTLNPSDDKTKVGHLKENSCYLVIKDSDDTNTPIVAFYYGESEDGEKAPYYFTESKSASAQRFSIKAIFLEEI